MIDVEAEEVLSLREAAASLPCRRAGKRTAASTLYRWTVAGCRGVVLDHIQIGGTRCTSREALQRFFDRLTHASRGGSSPPVSRSSAQRQRRSEAAAKELERLGA